MDPIDQQITEYLYYCQFNRCMTDQTMASKRSILTNFAKLSGVTDMQEFTNRQCNAWIATQIRMGVSGRTVNTRVNHVIAFTKWLRDMDYDIKLKIALISKVKEEPPRRNFYTREQIELVKSQASPLEEILISLTFDSGLRLSELTYLTLDNINGRIITLIGKGRKRRTTCMTEETAALLDRWILRKSITHYLWPSPLSSGLPYSTDQIRYIMKRAFARVGITDFYPHALRHSFGTDLQVNDVPIMVIQKLLGHANSATTERYLHGLDSSEKLIATYDFAKNLTKQAPVI